MKTILLVDDDEFVTTVYFNRLSSEGYDVHIANDGVTALELLDSITPNLIVLDLNMPGLTGVDVLKGIRERPETADCPVFVLSYGYVQTLVKEALSMKVIRVFTKSMCPPNKMIEEIKTFMENLPETEDRIEPPPEPEPTPTRAPAAPTTDPLAALKEASESTVPPPDLSVLSDDTPPGIKRAILAGLFREIRPQLDAALSDPPRSPSELLAKALNNLFGSLYGNPGTMTVASAQTLRRGIDNLNRLKPPPPPPPAEPDPHAMLNNILNSLEN